MSSIDKMGSEKRRKLQAWKPVSEAERIALYRRAWGDWWTPGCAASLPDADGSRVRLIERYLAVVETIAATLLRGRRHPLILRDDLVQVGYAELIRSIDRPSKGALALEKRIARNCRTAMIRFIKRERRERRYAQQGMAKAIRDTDAALGLPARERATRPVEIAPPDGAKFAYPDWLRGSVSVCRQRRAYLTEEIQDCDLPQEFAEIVHGSGYHFKHIPEDAWRFYMRPTLECLRQALPDRRTSQHMHKLPVHV